jgi:hypothetical protein
LQIQDRVVQERLLAPGFYVRQARSGPGQNAGRAQRGERRGAQTVCRHVGDDPPDLSEHPSGPVIPRIESPEHVCQLCKDNTGMIGEAHRQQAFHPLGYATLQNIYVDAGIE